MPPKLLVAYHVAYPKECFNQGGTIKRFVGGLGQVDQQGFKPIPGGLALLTARVFLFTLPAPCRFLLLKISTGLFECR